MTGVLGLDVGGANTKAAWAGAGPARTVSRPFEVWRDRDALAGVLRDAAAAVGDGAPAAVGLTMTAELSDAFATKREGVRFVLGAAEAAFGETPLLALTTIGELVAADAARQRPLDLAAANWVASALAVARAYDDALMIDVGSTTADVIPVAAGRVAARGRTDLDRLLAGELVYTGALRTNAAAIAAAVPVRGRSCPVAAERFAIAGDAHLVLGHLAPDANTCPTPDGRPATVECSRARLARLVCADLEQLAPGEVDAIAAFLHEAQVARIEAAVRSVASRLPRAGVVLLGEGAFLGRAAAARLGLEELAPPAELSGGGGPAAALARLVADRLAAAC
jgi:probable H4MPT-linked C1 transfer pathway protein